MSRPIAPLQVKWEKLPADYILPDDPVDNIAQPALAAALTESLDLAGYLGETTFTCTNYGICAVVDGKIVVKAPDWAYVAQTWVSPEAIARSYTPKLEGEIPTIVMEFLSEAEGTEYSIKPTYPPGKWFFYEQILQVPYYAIFDIATGNLEVYQLNSSQMYDLQPPNEKGRYWITGLNLYLGVWEGTHRNRQGYWLRWWNEQEELLLWGTELVQRERDRAKTLKAQLRSLGVEPEDN
ncbi:Uma2 family endonuclease [Euhalothece natronophila Z-M001]|uniref:Uma2 family endonuclease n=1 Tax=Euhalothece natronophila Z-M001 TaxID=522448 RepID=A0A5B8NS27_9CHRO|nr:Uma2 family endonuclease [Euhalothece natronophila]QDZ41045.1 Uma2 family endonuclease [Euhalothece natronophila Z-M001]